MNSGNYSADLAPKANPPVEATVNTGRNNNFNLLRLLLAGLVVVSHSFELVDGNRLREPLTRIFGSVSAGELAVDGFFLLSGFLIVQSWRNGPRLLDFMFARILRIYPGFIVTALICAFLVAPLGADARAYFGSFEPGRFLASVVMLRGPGIPATFEGTHYPFINNSLWTIKYEFMCYLCVAAVGLAGGLRTGRTWLWMTGLVLLVFTVRQGAQAFAPQAYAALPQGCSCRSGQSLHWRQPAATCCLRWHSRVIRCSSDFVPNQISLTACISMAGQCRNSSCCTFLRCNPGHWCSSLWPWLVHWAG
jgi:hypothetical protein